MFISTSLLLEFIREIQQPNIVLSNKEGNRESWNYLEKKKGLTIKMARALDVLKRSQVIFSDFPGGQVQGSCCFSPSNCLHMMSKKSPLVASLLSGVYRWPVTQLLPTLNQGLVSPETLASLLLPGKNLDTPQFQKQ